MSGRASRRWSIRIRAIVVAVGLFAIGVPATGQRTPLGELMQVKLGHAERLLAAVVLADAVEVEREARRLRVLSDASTWSSRRTEAYEQFAALFQDAAAQLEEEARFRDADGMAEAYTELMWACIGCHREVGAQPGRP